jgi:glycosyltransferase involved in cell wall biosynthesis
VTGADVPLVSVVVPVHDREHCVVDAVRSVLAQTHEHLECIVVDDGSTDGTVAALTAAFADDPRVRVFPRPHVGVSAARNHGIAQAGGELVTFLDSDDLMVEHRIAHQVEELRTADVDAVMGRQHHVLEGGAARPDWLERHPDWWDGYYHTSILVATWRVRAIGGFDEGLAIGEDIDLVVRLAGAGARIGVIEEGLVVRRFFGDNLSYASTDDFEVMLGAVRRHRARLRETGTAPDEVIGGA